MRKRQNSLQKYVFGETERGKSDTEKEEIPNSRAHKICQCEPRGASGRAGSSNGAGEAYGDSDI